MYVCDFDRGLDNVRAAMEVALRIGDQHAEMFAKQAIGGILATAGRYLEAEKGRPEALQLARKLKSRRFEAVILATCAEIALGRGLKAEALAFARTGLDLSQETGHGFIGPIVFSLLALAEDRREDQETALTAGEALLEQGSVGHNQFSFRRFAIERALLLEDWNQAERHADALLVRMANEPLVFSSWVAQRGKILARYGRSEATDADEDGLKRILEAAADADFRIDALGELLRQI